MQRRSFLKALGALVASPSLLLRLPAEKVRQAAAAMKIPFRRLPTSWYIRGPRYSISISRPLGPEALSSADRETVAARLERAARNDALWAPFLENKA